MTCLLQGRSAAQSIVQEDSAFHSIRVIHGDIVDAAIDHLDNLYVISSTGRIKKMNAAGDSLAVYNQVRNFGQPHNIDVSNPLKILLFYKDFSTVVVLDRFLSVRSTIDLRKYNMLQPGAIGLSYDNNIWVFDEYDSKLKKIDESGNLLLETSDFRNALGQTIIPQRIINSNGFVYLADPVNGIFAFDNYGTFKRKIPLQNWKSFSLFNNRIVTTGPDFISLYDPSNMLEKRYRLPSFQPYFHSFITSNRFVTLSRDTLQVYGYKF
jgi:hypothetical protein